MSSPFKRMFSALTQDELEAASFAIQEEQSRRRLVERDNGTDEVVPIVVDDVADEVQGAQRHPDSHFPGDIHTMLMMHATAMRSGFVRNRDNSLVFDTNMTSAVILASLTTYTHPRLSSIILLQLQLFAMWWYTDSLSTSDHVEAWLFDQLNFLEHDDRRDVSRGNVVCLLNPSRAARCDDMSNDTYKKILQVLAVINNTSADDDPYSRGPEGMALVIGTIQDALTHRCMLQWQDAVYGDITDIGLLGLVRTVFGHVTLPQVDMRVVARNAYKIGYNCDSVQIPAMSSTYNEYLDVMHIPDNPMGIVDTPYDPVDAPEPALPNAQGMIIDVDDTGNMTLSNGRVIKMGNNNSVDNFIEFDHDNMYDESDRE